MNLKIMKATVLYARIRRKKKAGKSLYKMRRLLALSRVKRAA